MAISRETHPIFDYTAFFSKNQTGDEKIMKGVWRSYKLFCFSGKIEQHTDSSFMEIADDGVLTLWHSLKRKEAVTLSSGQWRTEQIKNRLYLYFEKKQAFEIITFERENLVLSDIVKGEKIFFAGMPGWYQRIEPEVNSVRHIKQDMEIKKKIN